MLLCEPLNSSTHPRSFLIVPLQLPETAHLGLNYWHLVFTLPFECLVTGPVRRAGVRRSCLAPRQSNQWEEVFPQVARASVYRCSWRSPREWSHHFRRIKRDYVEQSSMMVRAWPRCALVRASTWAETWHNCILGINAGSGHRPTLGRRAVS